MSYELTRINKLVESKSVNLGEIGIVTCTKRATENAPRKFSVRQSKILKNRGNYTLKQLREILD